MEAATDLVVTFDQARFPYVMDNYVAYAWLQMRAKCGAPSTTIEAYGWDLNDYLQWLIAVKYDVFRITGDQYAEYVNHLKRRQERRGQRKRFGRAVGLSDATVYRRTSTVRQFYDYMMIRELRNTNPVTRTVHRFGDKKESLIVRPPKSRPWIPNEKQWNRIVEVVSEEPLRNRTMFAMDYELALRRSELCLAWTDDFDHAHANFRVDPSRSKSARERILPFSTGLNDLIISYEQTLPWDWPSDAVMWRSESNRNRGKALKKYTWNKVIETIRDRANVPRFHPHTIRHMSLTDLARSGWDILAIKEFAGHEDISTTQHYITLSGRDLADAYMRASNSFHRNRSSQIHAALQA